MNTTEPQTKPLIGQSRSNEGLCGKKHPVDWRVNTPQLLQELGSNPGMGILRMPLHIFSQLLFSVGERASELNDPRLNELMARLAIYAVADPYSPDYDEDVTRELLTHNA